MCLVKTHELPKISKDEIKVYKVLLSNSCDLITPWMKEQVKDMKLEAKHPYTDAVSKPTIEGEGVHAYANPKKALAEWLYLNYHFGGTGMTPKIYKAIIPPKTPYWEGQKEDGDIAATKLLIKEEILRI